MYVVYCIFVISENRVLKKILGPKRDEVTAGFIA